MLCLCFQHQLFKLKNCQPCQHINTYQNSNKMHNLNNVVYKLTLRTEEAAYAAFKVCSSKMKTSIFSLYFPICLRMGGFLSSTATALADITTSHHHSSMKSGFLPDAQTTEYQRNGLFLFPPTEFWVLANSDNHEFCLYSLLVLYSAVVWLLSRVPDLLCIMRNNWYFF